MKKMKILNYILHNDCANYIPFSNIMHFSAEKMCEEEEDTVASVSSFNVEHFSKLLCVHVEEREKESVCLMSFWRIIIIIKS